MEIHKIKNANDFIADKTKAHERRIKVHYKDIEKHNKKITQLLTMKFDDNDFKRFSARLLFAFSSFLIIVGLSIITIFSYIRLYNVHSVTIDQMYSENASFSFPLTLLVMFGIMSIVMYNIQFISIGRN